jgi:hypothetical protein
MKSKYMLTKKTIVIIVIIILFIILLYIINYKSYNNKKFYKCSNNLGKITDNIFANFNFKHNNENWDIYMPCGYNNVENELKTINVNGDKSKIIFGINGCDNIVSKNGIWDILKNEYTREYASELMPTSYILYDPIELKHLKDDYKEGDIYILKKNIQRKEGLKLSKDLKEILAAGKDDYRVAQKYMRNLYLINKRKVNLRIYLIVIIKGNKKRFYISRKGKCIYTNKEYNDNDFDFESNITSYHLDMNIYKKNPRDFKELIEYIDERGDDGKKLFRNIEKLMYFVSKAMENKLYQSNNLKGTTTFQIFGGDVIFDSNLHPYLLEFNKGPDMSARDKLDEYMKSDVQYDMFSLVGLLPYDYKTNSFFLIYEN